MKVLFYLLDGETNASSRHRALQYFPELRRHGLEPYASRPVPEGVYQALIEKDGATMSKKVAFYSLFAACRLRDVLRAHRFDVVVIQRDLFPFGPPLLERLLVERNSHLVYDTDDATYLRPSFTPNTPFQRLRKFGKVAQVVTAARWVSAATESLADWARRYNQDVSVVPMAIDLADYDCVRHSVERRDRVVIGWAGTAGGLRYLNALAPTFRAVAAEHDVQVRVISGGYQQVRLPGVPLEAKPWRLETALSDMADFDIGVVPLDDTPFEAAKFPFKLLQYLALGIPVVSARVGVAASLIHEGENGLLASSNAEWRDKIEALIVNADLRRRLAANGLETVANSYTLQKVAPLVVDGLTRAAA